ncbi:MAG: hypothetical protein JNK31_01545 [Candidatus Competibacter sp.]|nr:hypothetical protein [Candidatus Competibacter sp.]
MNDPVESTSTSALEALPLDEEIDLVERRIQLRQQRIVERRALLGERVHREITSPGFLLATFSAGFIVGELTGGGRRSRRERRKDEEARDDASTVSPPRFLRILFGSDADDGEKKDRDQEPAERPPLILGLLALARPMLISQAMEFAKTSIFSSLFPPEPATEPVRTAARPAGEGPTRI